jgi:hypothetical protein
MFALVYTKSTLFPLEILDFFNEFLKNWQVTSSCMRNKLNIALLSLPHFFSGPSCLLDLHPDISVQTLSSLSQESDKHPPPTLTSLRPSISLLNIKRILEFTSSDFQMMII